MSRYSKIYICLILLALCITGCSLADTYERYSTANISLSESLYNAYADTDMDELIWYLAASKQWQHRNYRNFSVIEHTDTDALSVRIYQDNNYKNYGHPQQLIDLSKDTHLDLKTYKKDVPGNSHNRLYSALVLKFDTDFFVCIDEYSNDEDRTLTRKAIDDIESLFAQSSTYKGQLLEDKSIMDSTNNTMGISCHDARCRISGYIHLQDKSSIGIKVKDVDTDEEYFNQFTQYPYTITVGWGDVDTEYYYYEFDINIKNSLNDNSSGNFRIELWASNNSGETCIISKDSFIEFWSR